MEVSDPALQAHSNELELLLQYWSQAFRGEGKIVFVGGEMGVGKSILMHRLKASLADRGQLGGVLEAKFEPGGPLEPFPGLLEVDLQADELQSPDLASAEMVLNEQFNRLGSRLDSLSDEYPRLIVLHNTEEMDSSTCNFMQYLGRQLRHLPAMLVATYRSDRLVTDEGSSTPFGTMLMRFSRERLAMDIRLTPMALEEVVDWIRAQLGSDDPPALELAEYLLERTRGMPFHIRELFSALLDADALRPHEQRWLFQRPRARLIPASIQELFDARLSVLTADQKSVLEVASVLGPDFPDEILEITLDPPSEDAFLNNLDVLFSRNVLREQLGRLGFVLTAMQEHLLEQMHDQRRLQLHRQAAMSWMSRSSVPGALKAMINHARLGGLTQLAFEGLATACRESLAGTAFDEARDYGLQALKLARKLDSDVLSEHMATLLHQMWQVSWYQGQWDDATHYADRMMQVTANGPAVDRALALRCSGSLLLRRDHYDEAEKMLEESIYLLKKVGQENEQRLSRLELAVLAKRQGNLEHALEICSDLQKAWTETKDRGALAQVGNLRADILSQLGKYEEALEIRNRLRAQLSVRNKHLNSMMLVGNGVDLFLLGRFDESIAAYEEAAIICRELDDRRILCYALSNEANAHLKLEDFERAMALLREARPLATELKEPILATDLDLVEGQLMYHLGDYDAAMQSLTRAVFVREEIGMKVPLGEALIELGELKIQVEKPDEARELFTRAAALFAESGAIERSRLIIERISALNG